MNRIPLAFVLGSKGALELSSKDVEVSSAWVVSEQIETVGSGPNVLAVLLGQGVETDGLLLLLLTFGRGSDDQRSEKGNENGSGEHIEVCLFKHRASVYRFEKGKEVKTSYQICEREHKLVRYIYTFLTLDRECRYCSSLLWYLVDPAR